VTPAEVGEQFLKNALESLMELLVDKRPNHEKNKAALSIE